MRMQRFVTSGRYWHRMRLALWLAFHALKGDTSEMEWGDEFTTFTAIGVTTRVK